MKKLFISAIAMTALVTSCKKEEPVQPQVVTKTVTIHDTVPPTKVQYVHDTVYISITPLPLIGEWKLWKLDNYINGSYSNSDFHSDYTMVFGPSTINESLGSSGTYNYPVTYGSGFVDIKISSTATSTYIVENINQGQEYKLTRYNGTKIVQIWFLKK